MNESMPQEDTAGLSALQRIDEICDRFEKAWLKSEQPRIENCLDEVNEDERAGLLRQLLKVELELRIKAGEDITLEEYEQRFQMYSDLVPSVVKECLSGTRPPLPAESSVPDVLGSTSVFGPPINLREPLEELPGPVPKPQSKEVPQSEGPSSRYRIDGEINSGGMGAILIGRDMDLGRDIAVKVMLEKHRNNVQLCQRFVEEAQIGGQLQHPGIVPVYELGRFRDERPYFTMKLIKGQTLETLLNERKEPSQDRTRFLKIFEQICQTLAYAHARGVIHRDLKPLNVMVGAFGEVQVMDWGLAKVLSKERSLVAAPTAPVVSVIRTVRTYQPDRESQAGTVMGTWAYMPTEQARGETETLDERCDVFGLGSILCVILTGHPAYRGIGNDAYIQALTGDIADAFARLDTSSADPELVALTKRCLAVKADQRPRNAGVLACEVTSYLESVERRLRQAELASAEAKAKAIEERKRRRVTVALAASVLALAIVGGGGWLWVKEVKDAQESEAVRHAAKIEREMEVAMQEAITLREQAREKVKDPAEGWAILQAALAAVKRAESLAAESRVLPELEERLVDLSQEVAKEEKDRRILARFEEIRMIQGEPTPYSRQTTEEKAIQLYRDAYQQYGVDLETVDYETAGKWLQQRAIRAELVATLDNCAYFTPNDKQRHQYRKIADVADPGPLSVTYQMRHALANHDNETMLKLAQGVRVEELTLTTLADLSAILHTEVNANKEAEAFLRQAQVRHPEDFWINRMLGHVLAAQGKRNEALQFYYASLSIRPQNARTWLDIGLSLQNENRLEEAISAFQKAIAIDPDYFIAHFNLGLAHEKNKNRNAAMAAYDEALIACERALKINPADLWILLNYGWTLGQKEDWDNAIIAYRKTIRLHPDSAEAHKGLGYVLRGKKDWDAAITEFKEAIRLQANFAEAHAGLGWILLQKKMLDEAVSSYKEAVHLNPGQVDYHANLGIALAENKLLDEAVGAFKEALRLKPDLPETHYNLGLQLQRLGNKSEAAKEYKEAVRLKPDYLDAHNNLGNVLRHLGKLNESVEEYKEAIRLKPEYSPAHHNLGNVLQEMGRQSDAVKEYEDALRLKPNSPDTYTALGSALHGLNKLPEAEAEHRKALRLKPDFAMAHDNLGNVLHDMGKLSESEAEHREAILLEPELVLAHNNLGVVLIDEKKPTEAIQEFEIALCLNPDELSAHLNLANAHLSMGNLGEAETESREALCLKPEYPEAHNVLGNVLLNRGKPVEALREYCEVLRLCPSLPQAHKNLGRALHDLKQPAEAIKEYREALRLNPDYPEAYCCLGNALQALAKPAEAAIEYRNALRRKQDYTEAHNNLGNVLGEQGKSEEAIKEYREVMRLMPNNAAAYNNLGISLAIMGKLEKAIAEYRKAIAIESAYADAHSNLGLTLQQLTQFTEALEHFKKAESFTKESDSRKPLYKGQLRNCERLIALDGKLPAALRGEIKLNNYERLQFALFCQQYKKTYGASARFFAESFTGFPELANDLNNHHRYNAACAASLAGCGQGKDATDLDDKVKVRWRKQALDWLQADLRLWNKYLINGNPEDCAAMLKTLQHWQTDPDLAGIRDPQPLAKLPEPEQETCRKLWADAANLLKKAENK